MRLSIVLPLSVFLSCCNEKPDSIYKYGIEPMHSLSDFRKAVAEHPEYEMTDLEAYLSNARFDIRYATSNNFTGEVIYPEARAFARIKVAEALKAAEDSVNRAGLGFYLFDAYRPYTATVKFYEVYKDTTYVASPYSGSRHNRGCAVDLTLYDLNSGTPLHMPTSYDDFTERAHPAVFPDDSLAMRNRDYLINVMDHFGFDVYPYEWWHFDFRGWEHYPLMDLNFSQLDSL